MKMLKRFVATMTSAVAMAAVLVVPSAFSASAIERSGIYADIVYEDDGDIRVDIMMNDVVDFNNASFDIEIGEGFTFVTHHTNSVLHFNDTEYEYSSTLGMCLDIKVDDSKRRMLMLSNNSNNIDYNGRFCYFYVERTDDSTPENSTVNCSINYLQFYGTDNHFHSIYEIENNPVMLASNEYIIGDVDGNGIIDGRDASAVLAAVSNDTSYNVEDIKTTFTSIFPDATCAATADANQDGIINYDDAVTIMSAYTAWAVGNTPTSNVGQIDIFEIFE